MSWLQGFKIILHGEHGFILYSSALIPCRTRNDKSALTLSVILAQFTLNSLQVVYVKPQEDLACEHLATLMQIF